MQPMLPYSRRSHFAPMFTKAGDKDIVPVPTYPDDYNYIINPFIAVSTLSDVPLFALHVPFFLPLPNGLALVVFSLPLGQCQENFSLASLQVDPKGNKGLAPLLYFPCEALDFVFVQEEFACP